MGAVRAREGKTKVQDPVLHPMAAGSSASSSSSGTWRRLSLVDAALQSCVGGDSHLRSIQLAVFVGLVLDASSAAGFYVHRLQAGSGRAPRLLLLSASRRGDVG